MPTATGPIAITGTLLHPDGSGANGILKLSLNTYGNVLPAAGGPKAVLPNDPVMVQVIAGVVQTGKSIYGNDALSGNTYYTAQFLGPGGAVLFSENWYISGTGPFDVGSAQPADVSGNPLQPISGRMFSGSSDPTSDIGNDGDFYINTASKTLFGPRTGGAWTSLGTLG